MCGIAGIYAFKSSASSPNIDELLEIRDGMESRGPDGSGIWTAANGRVALAHRRLSIIDLSENGHQPMLYGNGRYCITFNGEIYNYKELKSELIALGFTFTSTSDTEVVLAGYAAFKERVLEKLVGMFAFAIYDTVSHELFLARDHFGIKPLYWSQTHGKFHFASQVKALVRATGVGTMPSAAGHAGFLLWGFVPEPYTLYEDVRSLPPGHFMVVNLEVGVKQHRYFDFTREVSGWTLAAQSRSHEMADEFSSLVRDAVERHMVADVPVGVFLSAGIDSTTIAAIATEFTNKPLRTVTLGFDEFRDTPNDETTIAQKVADKLGTAHSTVWVNRQAFEAELPRILEFMDQPSCDGINSYFISKAAKQAGIKVVLSGLGGDELFRSYPSFVQIPDLVRKVNSVPINAPLRRLSRWLSAPVIRRVTSPKYASLLEYGGSVAGAYLLRRGMHMPWEILGERDHEFLSSGLHELRTEHRLAELINGITSPELQVTSLEMQWYMQAQLLRDTDWASMAHSVEVRVPFVDIKFIRALGPHLASSTPPTKKCLANAPRTTPIPEIVAKKKTGFVVPVRQWMESISPVHSRARGIRGWAQFVYSAQRRNLTALLMLTDAYGGRGGIAKFNRDLIHALSETKAFRRINVHPRHILDIDHGDTIPDNVLWEPTSSGGKVQFVLNALSSCWRSRPDVIFAGHINFSPLAWLLSKLTQCRFIVIMHGIDAWTARSSSFTNLAAKHAHAFVAVSEVTRRRFADWSKVDARKITVLPNCVDQSQFYPGPKSHAVARQLGIEGRRVLLTIGRLVSAERYKGFDEVLDILSDLRAKHPDIVYVIAGEGPDAIRLRERAHHLGVDDMVLFVGYVNEAIKRDLYCLADVYVMPSRGEGFGIVFLEAVACGTPAIGSCIDGGKEALLNGTLGTLVHPDNPTELLAALDSILSRPRPAPLDIGYYSKAAFNHRVQSVVADFRVESYVHTGTQDHRQSLDQSAYLNE